MRVSVVCLVGVVCCLLHLWVSTPAKSQKVSQPPARFQPGGVISALNKPGVHNTLTDISPDGTVLYITYSAPDFRSTVLASSRLVGGNWSVAQPVSFSDQKSDLGASINPSQDRMFFTSQRPVPGKQNSDPWNLWVTRWKANAWQDPKPVAKPVNTDQLECCVSAKVAGKLYFSSNREGSWDIFCAELKGDSVVQVVKVAGELNTRFDEWPSYVDPQERFMLLSSTRPGGAGGDDLYIAVRENGAWSAARNLGPRVNSPGFEDGASLSPDQKTLYYSSRSAQSLSQIYQIRVAELPGEFSSILAD
ncbi:MAG TPA: hypothetical protein PKE58_18775 [Acidobacteriota bacterium]|nr:hypothetical protein [Acidobacteriota bacterium]